MKNLKIAILGLLLTFAAPLAAWGQCSGQAPASTYCGNPTGAQALPGWKPFSAIPFPNIGGGTVVGNRGTSTATAAPLTNPILGIPGTSGGQIGFAGLTSGVATLKAQSAAGTPTLLLPNISGTLVVGPSSSTVGDIAVWNNTSGTLLADQSDTHFVSCGGVDDTATLQAALNMRGTIYLPPTACVTTSTLTGYSNTQLIGQGMFLSRIYRTGNFGDTITFGTLLPGGAVSDVTVKNAYFQHSTGYVSAELTTNGTTASGNPTLHFASVPAIITAGMAVFDVTTATNIIGTVLSTTSTTVTMSSNVGSSVGSGDVISFGLTNFPNFTGGTGSAHLRFRGCTTCYVQQNQFYRLPYSVVFEGGSILHFDDNITRNYWDPVHVGLQEGLAGVYFYAQGVWGNPTSIRMENGNFFGDTSQRRNVTYTASDASLTVVMGQPIGPKNAILSTGTEDIQIHGGLVGSGGSGIRFENQSVGATIDVRISGVQFDGVGYNTTNSCDIEFESLAANKYTLGATITGNIFNAEFLSLHSVCALDTGGRASVTNLNVTGNSFFVYVASPFLLKGVTGATVVGNTISGYNSLNVSATDQDWVTAAHTYSTSTNVRFADNVIGGGGATFIPAGSPGNYTYQGIVNAGASNTQTGTVNAGVVNALEVQDITPAGTLGRFTGIGGGSSAAVQIVSTGPAISWDATGQSADQKWWDCTVPGALFTCRAVNDAQSIATPWLTVTRGAGATISDVAFPNGSFSLGQVGNTGQARFFGGTSGIGTIVAQAVAGSVTLTLPTTTGTFPSTATAPIVLDSATGVLTCPTCVTSSGGGAITGTAPIAVSAAGAVSINDTAVTPASYGSATASPTYTVDQKGRLTAASNVTITPAVGSITGLGTGVATALGIAVGSAGAPVLFNGALGTPSSGTATNLTGLPLSTGISGAGTGILTALAINVGSAGAPVLFNGAGGTPSSIVLTNASGTAAGLTAGTASAVAVGGITGLGTGVGAALALNVGSAGAPLTFNGAGGTPSSITLTNGTGLPATALTGTTLAAGVTASSLTSLGTITSLTATTINAFTLGGTIAGGGNQINNVVIGTTTPLAGSFTTLTTSTSAASQIGINTAVSGSGTNYGMQLVVQGAATFNTGLYLNVSNGASGNYGIRIVTPDAGAGNYALYADGTAQSVLSGGLSLGTSTDPGAGSLQVNANIYAPNLPTTTDALAAALCWTVTTGQFQRDTNAGGCLVSNAASKNSFERLDLPKSYKTVMESKPYSFFYNDNKAIGRQIGFKADDFVGVDDRLVGFGAKGEVQTFRYQQYTAELTAAFQHRASIDDKRYVELKASNDNLHAEIAKLKNRMGAK